ncbi:MAG: hypothetical protein WDZ70_02165 [Candidatus Paceibacterota bacterium]
MDDYTIDMVLLALSLAGYSIAVGGILWLLAQNKVFFGFVREKQAINIMRFDGYSRTIMAADNLMLRQEAEDKGYLPKELLEDAWEKLEEEKGKLEEKETFSFNNPLPHDIVLVKPQEGRRRSLYLIGLWPIHQAHRYNLIETKYKQQGGDSLSSVVEETQTVQYDHVPLNEMVRVCIVADVELPSGIPVTAHFSVTLRLLNTYTPIFDIKDSEWLGTVFDQLGPVLRGFLGHCKYEELATGKTQNEVIMKFLRGKKVVPPGATELLAPKQDNLSYWANQYRVGILRVDLQTVDPSGGIKEEMREATTIAYRMEQEGKAEASKIRQVGDAHAHARDVEYEAILKRGKGAGLHIRRSEAIEKTNASTLVLGDENGSRTAIPIGGDK